MAKEVFSRIPEELRDYHHLELNRRSDERAVAQRNEASRVTQEAIAAGMSRSSVLDSRLVHLVIDRWRGNFEDSVSTWLPLFFKYAPEAIPELKGFLFEGEYFIPPNLLKTPAKITDPMVKKLTQEFLASRERIFRRYLAKCKAEAFESENGAIPKGSRSKEFRVFWSWQSTIPQNKAFVQKALKMAAQALKASEAEIIPRVEHDTKGNYGSPKILDEILRKIDTCDCMVADLTIVNRSPLKEGARSRSKNSPICNPNVLLELGYALKKLGGDWGKIIVVANDLYGIDLPFDIEKRRLTTFRLDEGAKASAFQIEILAGRLTGNLRGIAKAMEGRSQDPIRVASERVTRLQFTRNVFMGKASAQLFFRNIGPGPALDVKGFFDVGGGPRAAAGAYIMAEMEERDFVLRFNFGRQPSQQTHVKFWIEYRNNHSIPHRHCAVIDYESSGPRLSGNKTQINMGGGWADV